MTTANWQQVKDYQEIIFERADKVAKITMNRPKKLNAFTPVTIQEMIEAFTICRDDSSIGVIILTATIVIIISKVRVVKIHKHGQKWYYINPCLLYTSDAADE